MIFGSGYDQAGAMLMQQASLAEQHALNQARMDAEANQFAARQREAEDAKRFQFAQFAANRADEAARLDQAKATFNFTKAAQMFNQDLSNRQLANDTRRINFATTQDSAAKIKDLQFKFDDAAALADAGTFKSLEDIKLSNPFLSEAAASSIWRRNVEGQKMNQANYDEAQGIADMLNRKVYLEELANRENPKVQGFFEYGGQTEESQTRMARLKQESNAEADGIADILKGVNKDLLKLVRQDQTGRWAPLISSGRENAPSQPSGPMVMNAFRGVGVVPENFSPSPRNASGRIDLGGASRSERRVDVIGRDGVTLSIPYSKLGLALKRGATVVQPKAGQEPEPDVPLSFRIN